MKKVLIVFNVVLMVCVFFSVALAQEMGMSQTNAANDQYLANGQYSIGIGYDYMQQKLKGKSSGWGNSEIEQNLIYVKGIYNVDDIADIYLEIGGADFKIEDAWGSGSDFKDDYGFFGTLGVKSVLFEEEEITMGFFLDGTLYSDYKDSSTISGTEVTARYEDIWDITLGLDVATIINEATIYGGPLFYITNAKASVGSGGTYLGRSFPVESSSDYESKDNLGAYIGTTIPFAEEFLVNIEVQYKGKFCGTISVVKKL